jgi:hypothetical protein
MIINERAKYSPMFTLHTALCDEDLMLVESGNQTAIHPYAFCIFGEIWVGLNS